MSIVTPLDEHELKRAYDHAHAWEPFNGREKVLGYLEDTLSNISSHLLQGSLTGSRVSGEISSPMKMQLFYTTVVWRYLQGTSGAPKYVQCQHLFNNQGSNQVEDYIRAFFIRQSSLDTSGTND